MRIWFLHQDSTLHLILTPVRWVLFWESEQKLLLKHFKEFKIKVYNGVDKYKFWQYSILQLCAWLPSLLTGVRLKITLLLWYKPCCFSNVNWFVVKLTSYWSLLPSASLQIKGLVTKYSTVKWPIQWMQLVKVQISLYVLFLLHAPVGILHPRVALFPKSTHTITWYYGATTKKTQHLE